MNLHRTALLLLGTATASSCVTWGPIRTRSAPISTDNIIATLPATTTTPGNAISVNGADVNVGDVVGYFGEGVTVMVDSPVDSVEANAVESIGEIGTWSGDAHSSVAMSGSSKSSKGSAFWSATSSKGSVTGNCFYSKGSAHYKKSSKGSLSYSTSYQAGSHYYKKSSKGSTSYGASYEAAPLMFSSKKSRSHKSCACEGDRRHLQWGNDGHSSVSVNSVNKNSFNSKTNFGSSKVSTVKVSGSSSKLSSGGTSKISSKNGGSVSFKENKSKGAYIKGSASITSYCSCEDSFEIDLCETPSGSTSPTPSPVNPLVPKPSVPPLTAPPTVSEPIQVNGIDCADDFVSTSTGVAVEIPVLDNDGVIPHGSTGSIIQPSHGLSIITDSTILYVPESSCCGIDTFMYTITDPTGQYFCSATVTVSVLCAGDGSTPPPSMTPTDEIIPNGKDVTTTPPSVEAPLNPDGGDLTIQKPVANDDSYTTNQDESVQLSILLNDTVIVGTTGKYSKPPNGELSTFENDLLYTPNSDFCGMDRFSYTLTDATGQYSDSAVVTIVVVCAPVPTPSPESAAPTFYAGDDLVGVPSDFAMDTLAPSPQPSLFSGDDGVGVPHDFNNTQSDIERPELNDDYGVTNQSVPVFIPILDNDIIPQDSTGSMGTPVHGEVEAIPDGIIYTPVLDYCGTEKFDYSVTDSTGMFTDTAEVTVEILCAENDNIEMLELNDDFATTKEGEAVIIPILANDKIPSDSTGSFSKPKYGVVNTLDGDDILYTPKKKFCGKDTFTYTIYDSVNNSATATVTIDVICGKKPVNHRPVANDDDITACEGQQIYINVAANDEDDNDDALTVTSVAKCREGGALTIIGDGTGGVVEYTHTPGFYGTDHCDYMICDTNGNCDEACVLVTTEKCIEPPLAVNDYAMTEENTAIEIEVTENDISPNGTPLTIVSVGDSDKDGVVAIVGDGTSGFVFYEPTPGFVGNDKFTYTITDAEGQTSTAIVSITVGPSAAHGAALSSNTHACTTTENAAVIYVIDGNPSSLITIVTNGANGSCEVTESTTITYTPVSGFSGTDTCEYELCNESGCSSGLLTISVIANDTPSEIETTVSTGATTTTATASAVLADTTSTVIPQDIIESEIPVASYMCPGVDSSNVTETTLLYQYQVVLDEDTDINAAIEMVELKVNDRLASQMRCGLSRTRRTLLIAGLVGASSSPSDTVSDDVCDSDDDGRCVVINGGITVYGDISIQDVQGYVGSVMAEIVSSVDTTVIKSELMTSSATLDSNEAITSGESISVTTIAIASAAVVALLGSALFIGKNKSRYAFSDESKAVLKNEFPDIPHGSSNDSDTILTSFDHKSNSLPSSPVFSVNSSKSKSYDIKDTVDL